VDDLTYQHLDEIPVDPPGAAIRVQYSEPDQGGTQLLLRVTIPANRNSPPILSSGYAHDEGLKSKEVSWGDLPERIASDLLPWLADQRRTARSVGKLQSTPSWVTSRVRWLPANTPLQSDGHVGRCAPSRARR
jgi:hypothetical protein